MLKDYSYTVWLIKGARREQIGGSTKDPVVARKRARGLRPKHGRVVVIERDGKELPGGAFGLDKEVYERWLTEKKDER